MRVVVVGGGISGLAAAAYLRRSVPPAEITIIEQRAALGGKLRTGAILDAIAALR